MIFTRISLSIIVVASSIAIAPAAQAEPLVDSTQVKPQTRAASAKVLTFYWGLQTKESAARGELKRISDPRSRSYRKFTNANTVAKKYGATKAAVRTVSRYVRSKGLTPLLDRSRLFMRVRGTSSTFEKAFNTTILGGQIVGYEIYIPRNLPVFPKNIARLVPSPVWIAQYQVRHSSTRSVGNLEQFVKSRATRSAKPTNQGTLFGVCKQVRQSPYVKQMMSVAQLAKAYKFSKFQIPKTRGEVSNRPLIGVISAGSGYSNSTFAQAKKCFGTSAQPHRVRTDGMSQPLAPGLEGSLDTQVVAAALRGHSRFPVYESGPIGFGQYLGYVAALNSKQRPAVLTASYGLCEATLLPQMRRLADSVFLRLGLTGTSVLAAAGDSGSSGCTDSDTGLGPRGKAVWYPASSPYVTGVGGTRVILNRNNSIRGEVVWNDKAFGGMGSGGGGNSTIFSRPWWQPRSGTGGTTAKRAVPDLSAHADSGWPGYAIFVGDLAGQDVIPVGGTSAATPLIASAIALLNRQEQMAGRPSLGFLNPWLYQVPRKAIRDVRSGNNDLYGNGCCQARRGYDRASGLGSPYFQELQRVIRPPR